MYKFSNFIEGYDKTQINTVKLNNFTMPDNKIDQKIYYVNGFSFIKFIAFSSTDIMNKKND
jgi:hypothetical protein